MCIDNIVLPDMVFEDWGLIDYHTALDRQHLLFDHMVELRRLKKDIDREYLIFAEHPTVITMGRRADKDNLITPKSVLDQRGIDVVQIERGGDVTVHAPGQLVVYPIIDLRLHSHGVKDYVDRLEQAVIRTIARFGVKGDHIDGASGVWIGRDTPNERKICALGIKCSHFVTMHGLALNVNTDMSCFSLINPCGFVDKGVTSLAVECQRRIDMNEVKSELKRQLTESLSILTLNH